MTLHFVQVVSCMTKSIRKARATFICGKCGHDKTYGDVCQEELK